MATFIQGVTDTNLDPVLFTPDYSFLRYVLGKKTEQYQQGLKSVSSSYAALQKELTDPVTRERRDTYLKAAETQLQNIASADLSLQQNVNAANAIFDPIATDPAVAYDMFHTENNRRQLAAMQSWATSDDMATRKKFNKDIYDWVSRDLDSLKTGNGDISNYKVQGRKAWAYVDAQDIINEAAKQQGFTVKTDELGNPYIVTTEGGATFRPNYEAFAKSVLDANPVYQQQRQILGQAKTEKVIERAMADPTNIGLSREQLLEKYADTEYDLSSKNQKQYLTGLNDKLTIQTAEYNSYLQQNASKIAANPAGPEAQQAQQMAANLTQFKSQIDNISSDYVSQYGTDEASFKLKKDAFKKGFLSNPEGYYANQVAIEDAIRFSNIRSSFGTRSVKADTGYLGLLAATNRSLNTLANIIDDRFDNAIDAQELGLKQATFANKLQGKSSTGERLKNADGTDKVSDVEYIGTSATQVNTVQKLNQLREKLEVNKAKAMTSLTSTYGGLYLLEKMGAKQPDVALVRGYISRKGSDENAKASREETQAMQKVYQTMWAWAKQNPDANAEMLESLRGTLGKAYKDLDFAGLLKLASKNYATTDDYDYQAKLNLDNYENYTKESERIAGLVNKGVDVVVSQIKNDDRLYRDLKEVLIEENGKTRVMQASDLVKTIPAKGWKEDANWKIDKSVELTEEERRELAEGIFDGRVTVTHRGKYMSGGDNPAAMFKTDGTFVKFKGRTIYLEDNFSAIPFTSSDLQKNLKRINERIPIPILESEVPGVTVTGSSGFVVRNQPKEDIRIKLAAGATQENANIMEADGSGTAAGFKDVDADDQQIVRNALADKDNVEQMLIWTNSPLNSGSQVVEVVMKSVPGEKAPSWSGKRYYFPINVNKTKNEIFSVFAQADELDEFMTYSKKNEPYKFDSFEGSGVKAEVVADQPGSKTGRVLLHSKFDPVTRQYVDNWITQEISFDLNKLSFAEMKQEIFNNFITPYMKGYMNYTKQTMGSTGAPGSNLLQQLKNVVTW